MLLLWGLLQAETVSHVLSPHIYPFQTIWIQMNITTCVNKCSRDNKHLLEMSLQFLNKIWHLCSLLHEKEKSLPSLSFSSRSDSDILRLWARSRATALRCAVTLGTSEGIAAWRRPVSPSSSSVWQYCLISLEGPCFVSGAFLYSENTLL